MQDKENYFCSLFGGGFPSCNENCDSDAHYDVLVLVRLSGRT